ncbi:MAG: glycosyl hydrolase family 28-related protein [Armatimonadota bacterium]
MPFLLQHRLLFILMALAVITGTVFAADVPNASQVEINVRDFGAKGDGQTDDTSAFQTALDECALKGGGVVSVPAGHYLIKTHLRIPSFVTLEGTWRSPATTSWAQGIMPENPKIDGSVLLAVEGAGNPDGTPYITLDVGATLKGVTIYYPNQPKTRPSVPYPWTVRNTGSDAHIIDVLMLNPYQAVDFGTNPSARHFIRNLYADPLFKGIYVDQCIDIGRMENVHFWPFWSLGLDIDKVKQEQAQAFILGRSDWEYISNSFVYNYKTGFRFIKGIGKDVYAGGGNYMLTQSGADGCETALLVESTQDHSGITFSNSQIFGKIVVKETNQGQIRFNGCNIFGTANETDRVGIADLTGSGTVTFANCQMSCLNPMASAESLLDVKSGHLMINGCTFPQSDNNEAYILPAVRLGPMVRSAIITGNNFLGKADIENRSKGKVVIANNAEYTEYFGRTDATGTIPISQIQPGTEVVDLLPNGDFSTIGTDQKRWSRWGDAYVEKSPVKTWKSSVALAKPGILKSQNGGYQRKLKLKPNTEYVLSGYIWNQSKGPNERVFAHIDMNRIPGEPAVRISPYRKGAKNGFFVYRLFDTATTGTDVMLRVFFNLPTDYADPKTVAAMWDNIAITPASKFKPPLPAKKPARPASARK